MLAIEQDAKDRYVPSNLEEAQFVNRINEESGAEMRVENVPKVEAIATKSEDRREERLTASKNPEENSKASQTEDVLRTLQSTIRTLQSTIAVITSKVEQMEQQVLQVTRIRSTLKRTKSQSSYAGNPLKEREKGNSGNKKQRLLDAARSEAARRRRMTDLARLFANILRQLMQHRWAWPFMKPVDVEGLRLHDYYRVIRKPMDLGTIRNRLEAKDGSGYRHAREMCEDVRLVFRNAMMYNESWTDVHKMARTLSQKFEEKWKMLIEPKLLEEEEKSNEDQQEAYVSEIAELRAGEERAAEKHADDVFLQLTDIEKQLEGYILKMLSKCRTMTMEEKQELGRRLGELSPYNLNRVIEIVSQNNTTFDAAAEKVQIDLESLDLATLWRLHFFVKMIANAIEERTVGNTNVTEGQTAGQSDGM